MNPIGFDEFFDIDSIKKGLQDLANFIDQTLKQISSEAGRLELRIVSAQDLAEIARLKQEIEALKKSMAEMKAAADTVASSQKKVTEATQAQANSIDDLKKKVKEAEKAYSEMGDAIDDAVKQEALNNLKKLTTELEKAQNVMKEAKKEAKNFANAIDESANTLDSMRAKLKRLTSEANSTDIGTQKFKELEKEIAKTTNELKKLEEARGDYRRNVGNYAESFKTALTDPSVISSLAGGAGIGSAIGGALGSLGGPLVGQAVGAIGEALDGLASKIAEVNKELATTQTQTGLAGNELNSFTAKAQSVAQTFGKDYNEVLQAATSLSKGMGISFNQAIDLINKGFVKGADVGGDFLDKVKEYPVQFKEAGFSAEQMIKVAIQEPKSGIFSGKLLDTVKETNLSLKEMTKAQKDALNNAFGVDFTNKLASDLDKGKKNTIDAFKLIESEAKRLGLTASQTQTLVADVFKGAGEDAGGLTKVLDALNEAMAINIDNLTEAEQRTLDNQKATEEYDKELIQLSQNFSSIGTPMSTFFTKLLTYTLQATNGIIEYSKRILGLIPSFKDQQAEFYKDIDKLSGKQVDASIKDFQQRADNLTKRIADIKAGKEKPKDPKKSLADSEENLLALEKNLTALYKRQDELRREFYNKGKELSKENTQGVNEEEDKAEKKRQRAAEKAQNAKQKAQEKLRKEAEKAEEAYENKKKKENEERIKQQEDIQKANLQAKMKIEDMEISMIQDKYEKEEELLKQKARREILAIEQGLANEKYKAEQIRLINESLTNDITEIRKKQADELEQEEFDIAMNAYNAQIEIGKKEEEARKEAFERLKQYAEQGYQFIENKIKSTFETRAKQLDSNLQVQNTLLDAEVKLAETTGQKVDLAEREKQINDTQRAQAENEQKRVKVEEYLNLLKMISSFLSNGENPISALAKAIGLQTSAKSFGDGKFEGGFTDELPTIFIDKNGREAKSFVHGGEYTGPEWQVKELKPVFDSLEKHRLTGHFDLPSLYNNKLSELNMPMMVAPILNAKEIGREIAQQLEGKIQTTHWEIDSQLNLIKAVKKGNKTERTFIKTQYIM